MHVIYEHESRLYLRVTIHEHKNNVSETTATYVQPDSPALFDRIWLPVGLESFSVPPTQLGKSCQCHVLCRFKECIHLGKKEYH